MPPFKLIRLVALTAPLLVFAPLAAPQQSDVRANTGANVSAFTAAQAAAGRAAYQERCASCHLPDLRGSNEAPPLAGAQFREYLAQPHHRRSFQQHSQHHARK